LLEQILINRQANPSTKNNLRKRHWFAGSMVVLFGSWITHTTTATIAQPGDTPRLVAIEGLAIPELEGVNNSVDTVVVNAAPLPLLAVEKSNIHASLSNPVDPFEGSKPDSSAIEDKVEQALRTVTHKVKRGETLGNIFRNKSFDLAIAHYISLHDEAKRLVSLSIGRELQFKVDDDNELKQVVYPINSLQELKVKIVGQQVESASISDLAYTTEQHSVSATIDSSLYMSALDAGLSNNLIMEMVRIFGWDIDFVQDIRAGDSFHVIFSDYRLDGEKLSDGNILAAEFTTQGNTFRAIRFEDDDGGTSYYTPEGESMLGTFLRSPVEFSRISSRFGKRKHPISKKWKTHKGVDYAASRGTPIRATADGKVISAGRNGGYGKTVVLRHAGRFSTLYAHMNGFAKKIRSGARVKQGQIIGYVGSTGYSTGPHLHYEFRVDGVHRNSLTYKTPKASSVAEKHLQAFNQVVVDWEKQLDSLQSSYQIALNKTNEAKGVEEKKAL